MPLGAAKIAYQGYAVASAGPTVRNVSLTIGGDTQFDRSVYKWDNSSLAFDGTGDGIATDDTLDLSSGAWTMECWLYATNTNTTEIIFDPRFGSQINRILGWRNGRIAYYSGSWQTSSNTFSASTWYHFAWVYDGTNVKGYVNGTLELTVSESGTFVDSELAIGARYDIGAAYFNGHLQDIRISNTARYTSNFTAPTQSLTNDTDTVLFINDLGFDGDNDIRDDGGSRRYVAPDLRNGGELDTAQYKFGSSSWYQSANGMGVELSSNQDDWWDTLSTTDPFTIEMWVRRQDNPSDTKATLFDLHANKFTLYYDESTNNLIMGEGPSTPRITGGSLSTNTWYHVALTRNSSGVCKLWIDGTQSGSNYTLLHNGAAIFSMRFFGDSTSRGWVGHIDECRFSTVERYSSSFTPSTTAFTNDADTAFLWHFDGTDAATSSIIDDNA